VFYCSLGKGFSKLKQLSDKLVVLRNTLFLSVKPVLSLAIGVFFAGYLGRHLGVTRYGNLNYSLSFVTLFSFTANFGVNTVLQRECAYASADINKLVMNAIYVKACLSCLTLVAVIAATALVGGGAPFVYLNLILVFYVIGMSLQNTFRSVFLGRRDAKLIAAVDLISQFLDVFVIVGILSAGGLEISVASGKVFVVGVALLLYIYFFGRKFGIRASSFDVGTAKGFMKSGFYITIITVMLPIYYLIGPVILGNMAGPRHVGIFQAANGFVEKLLELAMPFNEAIFPVMAGGKFNGGSEESSVDFFFYLKLSLLLAAIAWIGTYYVGPVLVVLFFGREYVSAQEVIRILAMSVGLRFVNNFLGTIFLARKKEKISSFLIGLQVSVYVLLCVVFVGQQLGAKGVGYAFVASEGLALVMRMWVLGRIESLPVLMILRRLKHFWYFVAISAFINLLVSKNTLEPIYCLAVLPVFPVLMLILGVTNLRELVAIKNKVGGGIGLVYRRWLKLG